MSKDSKRLLHLLLLLCVAAVQRASSCECVPIPSPPFVPVVVPDVLMLQPDFVYQYCYFLAHVVAGNRTFGVLFMTVTDAGPTCPAAPTFAWAVLADTATGQYHQLLQSGASITSTKSPYTLADEFWGLRQVNTSTDWRHMTFTTNTSDFAVELTLDASQVLVQAMGHHGVATLSGNCTDYHFAAPRMAAEGTVTLTGQTPLAVKGTMWYQNMWVSSPGSDFPSHLWVCIELSDGYQAQFVLFGSSTNQSYGNIVSPGGLNNTLVTAEQFVMTSFNPWVSPHTNISFDTAVRVQVPSLAFDVTLKAYQPDNELFYTVGNTAVSEFYEAVSAAAGMHAGAPVSGNGYIEHYYTA